MTVGRTSNHAQGRTRDASVMRPVLVFAASGAVAMLLLGIGAIYTVRQVAEREALADARRSTSSAARTVIEPALRDGVRQGDRADLALLDTAAQLLGSEVRRAKLWAADGTIVWADEPRLVGTRYRLHADELAVLRTGSTESEISDLSRPENRFERGHGKLLEVYTRVKTPAGTSLLYEEYLPYARITDSSRRVAVRFVPIAIGALLLLELVQVPLALTLVRRLEQRRREGEALLRQAIESSDLERRRIARDLHDGVVQQVAGTSVSLHAAAGAARDAGHVAEAASMGSAAAGLRSAVRGLRTLVVSIYPPNLAEVGIHAALADQLAAGPSDGPDTHLEVTGAEELDERTEALLFRVAQEAIRNALRHAGARELRVELRCSADEALLEVRDDGSGFDAAGPPPEGHVGMRIVRELVEAVGGQLDVSSSPAGTTLSARVPLR